MKPENEFEKIQYDSENSSENVELDLKTVSLPEPRSYQKTIFEFAKQNNCIAFLDTGSGNF